MKKENYLSVSFIAFLCVIFVSCQKETMFLTSNPNASVSTEVIGVNSAMGIVDSLINISVNLDEELSRGTTEDQLYTSIAKEQEIATVLQPLTECGQQLRTNLLIAACDPDNGFELSMEEMQMLENLNDVELAQMMLIVLTAKDDDVLFADDPGRKISAAKAKDCLFEAFGINDAIAICSTMAKGHVVKIAEILTIPKGQLLKLLSKIIGRANYIMLALTIAEFAYCMLTEDAYKVPIVEGQEGLTLQHVEMTEIFEGEVFKRPVILEVMND